MPEPTSHPPGGRTPAKGSAGTGGTLFAFLCWLVLAGAIAVFAIASFIRFELRAEADRRYALAAEQRIVAAAAAKLAKDLDGTSIPAAATTVSALRTRSLELLARIPAEPATGLHAEWRRLVTGLDAIEADWERILEFRTGFEALRGQGRALREGSDRLLDVLAGAQGSPLGRTRAQTLATLSRQFAGEVERASLTDPAGLERARVLLDIHARVLDFFAAETARQSAATTPQQADRALTLHTEQALAALASQLDAAGERLNAVRSTAGTLEPALAALRGLAESGARVMEGGVPDFEAHAAREPVFFGASLDAWLLRSAVLAFAALLGLFWRHQRLLRFEAEGLDQAWAEAAESDWRARGFVRDLLRAIGSLDRNPAAKGAPGNSEELEERVREATASLAPIIARRSQVTAALLSARGPLRKRLSAARDAVLAHPGPDLGDLDPAPLVEVETTFREATLFAMAALVREIRAAAAGPEDAETGTPGGALTQTTDDPETIRDAAARGFDLLERSLERVLAGEQEEHAALIFLLDDLRALQGMAPFSSSLDFEPDLALPARIGGLLPAKTGPKDGPNLRADAARMLPSFRKGLAEWAAGEGDGDAAARLVRGAVSGLAQTAGEGRSPTRSFWSVAAAFCTALCERAIPAGPAVRRLMGEVAKEFEETAERDGVPPPPDWLLRDLLICIALAENAHPEIEEVRAAFGLDRYPLAVPEPTGGMEGPEAREEGVEEAPVSEEIIQQLEEIRATLDRIDHPSGTWSTSRPPPSS